MKSRLIKRIVSFALAGAIILCNIPGAAITAFAATEYTYENFKYTVSNNEATITGCVDETVELIFIPATVDSYKVVAIGSYAFEGMSQLKTVWFSSSIKTIGSGAFSNCDGLTYIEIPDSVLTIEAAQYQSGSGAFSGCDNLQEVIIGDGLKEIREWTFYNCPKLESVFIGNSVEMIGKASFLGSALKSIVIPDSVRTIGYQAFCDCSMLSAVLFGNGLTTIDSGAFNDCDSLVSVKIRVGVQWLS